VEKGPKRRPDHTPLDLPDPYRSISGKSCTMADRSQNQALALVSPPQLPLPFRGWERNALLLRSPCPPQFLRSRHLPLAPHVVVAVVVETGSRWMKRPRPLQERRRDRQAEGLRRLEVDDQLKLGGPFDWQVCGLGALENLI
jgi:hypothetical protein